MPYLLDANVFIQASRLHYGFDFCPAFWDWLVEANSDGRVFSIERVSDEIRAVTDELSDWAKEQGKSFFLPPNEEVFPSLRVVSRWANDQEFTADAKSTFMQVADYFLVAHAHALDFVVVTHEVAAATIRRIKIPNVCIGLGVKCMTPYEMLRIEKARFVLGSSNPQPHS